MKEIYSPGFKKNFFKADNWSVLECICPIDNTPLVEVAASDSIDNYSMCPACECQYSGSHSKEKLDEVSKRYIQKLKQQNIEKMEKISKLEKDIKFNKKIIFIADENIQKLK